MEKSKVKKSGKKVDEDVPEAIEPEEGDEGKAAVWNASCSFDFGTDFCEFSQFVESQIVWAKIPGHPSWPALVQSKSGNGGIVVSWIEVRNGYSYASTSELSPNTEKGKKIQYFARDFAPNFKKTTSNKNRWTNVSARKSVLKAVKMVCEQSNVKDYPEKEKDLWKFAQSETFQKLEKICITQEVYTRCLEGVKGWGFLTPEGKYRKRKASSYPDSLDPAKNGNLETPVKKVMFSEDTKEESVEDLDDYSPLL